MTFSYPTHRLTHSVGTDAWASGNVFSLGLVVLMSGASTFAQGVATPPVQATVPTKQTAAVASGPAWKELTVAQQLSLKPLAGTWATLGEGQKRKWIAIAANYNSMNPTEQVKLHSRMSEWVSLSQQQRTQARLNFAESKQLTPDQKTATWEAYQALSAEEKAKLAIAAKPKPVGAAAAIKPVAPEKLAPVPVTRKNAVDAPKPPSAKQVVNPNTLLPQSPPQTGPAAATKN